MPSACVRRCGSQRAFDLNVMLAISPAGIGPVAGHRGGSRMTFSWFLMWRRVGNGCTKPSRSRRAQSSA